MKAPHEAGESRKTRQRRERWIKLIGIAPCLLLIAAPIGLMALIISTQSFWLIYLIGLALCAVFFRIFAGTTEQRREARARRAARKAEYRKWRDHRFFPVSTRARAAYLILCLEEVLKAAGQEPLRWEWALSRLWEVTEVTYVESWASPAWDYPTVPEEERAAMRDLFLSLDPKLEQLVTELLEDMDTVILEGPVDDDSPNAPWTLECIDKAEELLTEQGIPLPHDQKALDVLMGQRDKFMGKPFDGAALSSILRALPRATLIYLEPGMLLTKKPYRDWREIRAEFQDDYIASLNPMTCRELIGNFADDFGEDAAWPFSKDEIIRFFDGPDETMKNYP